MSTSDAAASERRVVGGETPPHRAAGARCTGAPRRPQNESNKQNHSDDEPSTGRRRRPSPVGREGSPTGVRAERRHDDELQNHDAVGPRFTSCLLVRICSRNADNRTQRSSQTLTTEAEISKADGRTDAFINAAADEDLKDRPELQELPRSTCTMLSSTVVTVLAPQWSHRIRRSKRFEGLSSSDVQDVTTAAETRTRLQEMDRSLSDASQARLRVPPPGTRRTPVLQTGSLDLSAAAAGSRRSGAAATAPSSPLSPRSPDPEEQRRNQAGLSSKPTTSSLLLSLRRFNTETNPIQSNPPYPSPAHRTHDAGSPSGPRDRTMFETRFFSSEDFTNVSCSKHASLSRAASDGPEASDRTRTFCDPPYGRPALQLTQSGPRRTTLTSTSWWKQVTQQGSPLRLDDDIRDELATPTAPPCIDKTDNKRFGGQILNSRDADDTEPVFKGNMNLVLQGGARSPGRDSGRYVRQQNDSNPREQKHHSVSDLLVRSKLSRTPPPPSFLNGAKRDETGLFSPNGAELQNSNRNVEFSPNRCLFRPNSAAAAAAAPHGAEPLRFTKPAAGLPPAPNAKPSSSFHSQTTIHASPYAVSPSQTPKRPRPHNGVDAAPLGLERSHASFPKAFHSKPAGGAVSKPNASLSSPNGSLLAPSSPTITSSALLTPPPTPVITSPAYSDTPPSSRERDAKNQQPTGGVKKARRVTWDDSVEPPRSEPMAVEPAGGVQSVKAPFIFSFLRSTAPNAGGKYRSLSSDSAELAPRRCDGSQRPGSSLASDHMRRDAAAPRQERTLSVESGAAAQCRSAAALSLPPDFSSGYKIRYSSPPYSTLVSSRSTPGDAKAAAPRSPLFQPLAHSGYATPLPKHANPTEAKGVLPSKPPPPPYLPLQNQSGARGGGASETDRLNNNRCRSQSSQIALVNNRVQVGAPSPHSPSATFVTETLVYSIKPSPRPPEPAVNTPVTAETKGETGSSSSTESQPADGNRRAKDTAKRSRFALKKSAGLARSESDRSSKSNNKMDQVLTRLRQTFSTRRSEDDVLFPWKWKRSSQTPSVSGSSDVSSVSDVIADSGRTALCEPDGSALKEENGPEVRNRWTQNRFALSAPPGSQTARDAFGSWPKGPEPDPESGTEQSDHKKPPVLTLHSPAAHQFDPGTSHFLSCRDPSPGRSPSPGPFGKPSSGPRSPFSPFSSLSPLSFPSPDAPDDVFYSPKLQRRRDTASPCEPGEGISLGSRRSRASTGPPSAGPGPASERFASSYADLKYGIEPGKSFSVSSVLSGRPAGPGRISTGSRFMSAGDLSSPAALTCGGDPDRWSLTPDWSPVGAGRTSSFPSDPGQTRSRSLPRSLTRCLTNWSSGVSPATPVNTCDWDSEAPPTPPPTPPLSPLTRRMSKPPSPSSPCSPSSPGSPPPDSPSPRGRLPSRGFVSSLTTFEESSDCSSDTTTDDEYYLETGAGGEKETEL